MPLIPIKPTGSRTPFYIVHGHGLNVMNLKGLADSLHEDQPLIGVQPDWLDRSYPPLDDIKRVAKHYADEILEHNGSRPLIIGGYSSGGVIAYEIRNQLELMGRKVDLLIVLDGTAEIACNHDDLKISKYKLKFLERLWMMRHPIYTVQNRMTFLSERRRITKPSDLQGYFIKLNSAVEIYDRAFANYKLQLTADVIHLFRVQVRRSFEIDPAFLGWKNYTGNEIKVYNIPGDHDHMFKQPNVEELARMLQALLDQV
jgi:thioesterase domain-containing protein